MKIKPCPFCGSENLKLPERQSQVLWVECFDCESNGPLYQIPYATKQQFEISESLAIDLWNSRK